MSKPAGRPLITMRQALEDPKVFGKILEAKVGRHGAQA